MTSETTDISINDEQAYIDVEFEDEDGNVHLSQLQLMINDDLDKNIDLNIFKTQYVNTMIKNTVNIYCKMCRSDNVYVFTKQTRSSDEATTKYYTCIDCGNKWNVN